MIERICRVIAAAALMMATGSTIGCGSDAEGPTQMCGANLPGSLTVSVSRAAVGDPVTAAEVADFTRLVTGFWKEMGYFQWIVDTSHGVDAATGMRDWTVWWTGTEVIKENGQVTFHHRENGGPDNIMIPTSRVLAQVTAGYLLTGDPTIGRIAKDYSHGLTATMLGMVWDESDTVDWIMARAIIPNNHTVTLDDGRTKEIDYSLWRHPTEAWNTHTIHVENNPYWGDIWAKNMRSKDDVPHIYLATAWLPYLAACAEDPEIAAAADEALSYMQQFTKDIVDSGYRIRSKNESGEVFIPEEDLASFVDYEAIMPNAECDAKLSSALIGYGEPLENDCQGGNGGAYEDVASSTHYYNYAIVKNFHLSALALSLIARQDDAAQALLEGLVERIDEDFDRPDADLPTEREEWEADLAVYLVQAGAYGLPLTDREARRIQTVYTAALTEMRDFEAWDVWDSTLPDGTYNYRPRSRVDIQDVAYFLQLCWSPFRSADSVLPVDCEVVADPTRWGT